MDIEYTKYFVIIYLIQVSYSKQCVVLSLDLNEKIYQFIKFCLLQIISDTPSSRKGRGGGGGGRRKRDDGEVRTSDESGAEGPSREGEDGDRGRKRKRDKKKKDNSGKESKSERMARRRAEKKEKDKAAGIEKLSAKQKDKVLSFLMIQ